MRTLRNTLDRWQLANPWVRVGLYAMLTCWALAGAIWLVQR